MENEINVLNIPAYQRQRSISARGRKKTSPPKALPKPKRKNREHETEQVEWKTCGICEGYFEKIDVAIIKLTAPLREGDIVLFEKPDGLFEQKVKSMQIDRKSVSLARTGSDIGLKVTMKPQVGGTIYKAL